MASLFRSWTGLIRQPTITRTIQPGVMAGMTLKASPFDQRRFAGHNKWTGGPDAAMNSRLAAVLNRAKAASMPKDNVEGALKKANNKDKDTVEDIIYECYGPGGIAMIIETVTDKKSRTVKEVKEVLNRLGQKGKIVFASGETGHSLEEMMDSAIEVGAEDMEDEEDLVEITCDYAQLNSISQALTQQKYEVQQMEATYVPNTSVEITDKDTLEQVVRCLDDMENLDDVVKIHCNVILPGQDE
ncbi:hypothetical protein PHYBLDRAFT_137947 [Phycomyces blakesleeanus NRRL 1555(-)]|uniref:YebC-like protein n=1 Tax=Phycomyces blakesleeanus (strain ATCC 8743b / DSM 1359 / FGSC 10004 / NBRC 33097 / NRRL 1555) TaxID=763407 RepID=A0A162V6P1_PHYB8|nr:hypothetical protein PHYBLDRAFT_137947 [Phycomyces blakesleeanus NRRL 1555(-)]OAD80392.1 hypothetical protein PHYBLDRAFT_137947 [Phycomyces blakesleeanus NRRL 1555(-)]|eukprot:XP_018298432.1 hypothetical protein PHYBLDRAFT_137947 [Phycomyces blakesleeanus NRRL 1555(-)]